MGLLKNNNEISYEYTDKDTQYKDIDMSQKNVIVDAQYIDTEMFHGNRFIEALPPITSDQASLNKMFTYIPPLPDWNTLEKMDPILRQIWLDKIQDVRFPLPYHRRMRAELYRLICRSYSKRVEAPRFDEVQICGNTYKTNTALLAHPQGEAINGLAVLGPSGTGKSTSTDILLNQLPNVIYHDIGGKRIAQIVYLFVTCPEISNFNTLYNSIAGAIDISLGNGMSIYENAMNKIKGLGNKSLYVKQLIEGFGIGLIILDEIQHLDLKTTNENSIEALLRLNNDTHVGFVVMGLPEAFRDLFDKPHTGGRFPIHIQSGDYCEDWEQLKSLIEMLFIAFDFCDGSYEIDDEMVNVFHQGGDGCIKYIDILFTYVVKDYLERKDKPEIVSAEYVKAVAEKYEVDIRSEMIKKITTDASDICWLNQLNELDGYTDAEAAMSKELSLSRESAIDTLDKLYHSKYNLSKIENAVDIYIRKGYTDQYLLIAKATEHLMKNQSDIRPKKTRKKVTDEEVREMTKEIINE